MKTPIATRFVDWDIPELSTLQDSKVYQLRVQPNEPTTEKLAYEQREQQHLFQKGYSANGLPL